MEIDRKSSEIKKLKCSFDNKVNKIRFDLKNLKMEAKRTEVLNLIYPGFTYKSDQNIWSV